MSFQVEESSSQRFITKYFGPSEGQSFRQTTWACHNTVASVAQSAARSSRCSHSLIVSLRQRLWKAQTECSGPLTSFTWRVNSNRACCLSGPPDGWSHGWLPGRLSAHLSLSLSLSISLSLSLTELAMTSWHGTVNFLKWINPQKNVKMFQN